MISVALLLLGVSAGAAQQQPMKTGRVTNADNGAPLFNAHVGVAGTNVGVLTDVNGRYLIPARDDQTLVISMLGYVTQRIPVQGRAQIDVALQVTAVALDEIQVVGYTTQEKRTITGSVASVSAVELEARVVATPQDALRGRVPGVTVRNTGQPGRVASVDIRGQAFTADNEPLYVVDGMYLDDLRNLNPNDIESIQVLKDASAASQYGARAANGVLIVTTRRGRAADGNLINLRTSYAYSKIPRLIPMLNAREYAEFSKMAYNNSRARLSTSAPPPAGVDEVLNGINTFDTDWQEEVAQPGHLWDNVLSMSGGSTSGDARYFLSVGYTDQEGTQLSSDFERYTVRANSELKRGRLTFGENLQISRSDRTEPTTPEQGQLGEALRMLPGLPVYNTEDRKYGNDTWGHGTAAYPTFASNPVGGSMVENNTYQLNEAIGTLYGGLDIGGGLAYRLNLGFRHGATDRDYFATTGTVRYQTDRGPATMIVEENVSKNILLENLLTFNRVFGGHNINAVGGITQQQWESNFHSASRRTFADESLRVLNAGTTNVANSQTLSETRLNSYLARVSYSFADKYMAEGSFRRDGSSRFGPANRWGNFYAGSVGWVLSEESFFSDLPLLGRANYLKLRGSYGTLGNQDFSDYEWMSLVSSTGQSYILGAGQGTVQPGLMAIALGNANIKWQDNSMANVGVDLGLFDNKLSLTAEYFRSESGGLLVRVPLVPSVGSSASPFVNAGSILNSGFEFSAKHSYTRGNLQLGTGVNLSTLKNKVLELGGRNEDIISGAARTAKGEELGHFWLMKTCGIFQNDAEVQAHKGGPNGNTVLQPTARPGDQCFRDINPVRDAATGEIIGYGDGIINTADREYGGSPWPDFEGGAFIDGRFRNLDFSVGVKFNYGNKIWNQIRSPLEEMDEDNNVPKWLKPWTPELGEKANAPIALFGSPSGDNNRGPSDRYLEDGSYMKLQNVQIGYNVPASLLDRIGVRTQTMRIYVNGQDLYTSTDYLGWDPEFRGGTLTPGIDQGSGRYPNPRTFIVGVDLGF